jgi:hypothetical protein
MATKSNIMAAIKLKVGGSGYGIWQIGLTHDPSECKQYWKDTEKQSVTHWSQWETDSLADANAIASRFAHDGMKGGTGSSLSATKPVYVYVF